jgi:DNA-binding response OmpR family regulator
MRILIVEDDINLADALKAIIEGEGYETDMANDGMEGLVKASGNEYDVIVLDVMLPKMNGFEVIKILRNQNISIPTLLLTARENVNDRVTGLDSGADDYMTKPFSKEELLARVRALSRRQGEVFLDELKVNGLVLNISSQQLTYKFKSVHLSEKEYKLMHLLMTNPNTIISKENMIIKVWGFDSEIEDNNVEAYISFLRKKLKYLNAAVSIHTVRKMGYRLEATEHD